MNARLIRWLALLLMLARAASAQMPGLDAPTPIGPFLNGVLPQLAPGASTGWNTVNAFPSLAFIDPLWLTPVPNTGDLLLVGKNGQIWRFPNNPAATQGQVVQVLDWGANTQTSEDQGFYSLVFHPEFGQASSANKDFAYVCYNHRPALSGAGPNNSYWCVSRFTWLPASGTLDPASETVLIQQYDPDLWHNGGAMFFDNAGHLNITCGDGGDSSAGGGLAGALSRTQRLDGGFFSGVFRIDVDNDPINSHAIRRQPTSPPRPAGWPASFTQGYRIPNDNPFSDPGGSILEEYHSLGLRSPHTAHYDAVQDEVWVGDVGEGAREEISRLIKGDNAQWGYREGSVAAPGVAATPPLGVEKPPFLDYDRGEGTCIIGGMRYRGALWNSLLGGKVLYGDHALGRIWTATVDEVGGPAIELIVDGFPTGNKAGLANFCTDGAGEIYLMNLNGTNQAGGTIRKLVSSGISNEPPQFLSQTGVFTDLTTLTPSNGVLAYDVAAPLWSDGAAKRRWIALPNDGSHDSPAEDIVFSEKGNWGFPAGTVFVKHFEVGTNENDPSQVKRLETRLLVCTENGGKYGVTYQWNSAGTDAELLTTGGSETYDVTVSGGGTVTRDWDYPSRADCMQCHTPAAGQALGFRTASLNSDFHYSATGRTANQLSTINALGLFDRTLTVAELENFIQSRAIDDSSAPLEHRVRSYLDSNCSHCHQPAGTIGYFDARLGTPLISQGLVNGAIQGHFSLPGGTYLTPGDAGLSALHVRLGNVGNGAAMPPLAKNAVDQRAVDLLNNYIAGLTQAEFQTTGSVPARYVRLTALSEVAGNPWTSVAEFSILDQSGLAIPTAQLSIHDFDSEELIGENAPATMAIDGDIATFWHTEWSAADPPAPHHITVDLGSLRSIGGYHYTPRQNVVNGRIAGYQVHYSTDHANWTLMDSGTWENDAVGKSFTGLLARRKARCEIAGPSGPLNGSVDVTIAFDTDVTDFNAGDIAVSGGAITKLRGSGYYYVATISPTAPIVSVGVPADVANTARLGSFASNSLTLGEDTSGPVATFTGLPVGTVNGSVTVGIVFDEIPIGFSMASLSASNAGLAGLSGSGTSYTVVVSPLSEGAFSITLNPAGITDGPGNPMAGPVTALLSFATDALFMEAESGVLTGGMSIINDSASSTGAFLWLADGGYPGNEQSLNPAHSATYRFVLPHSGNWTLEGLLRSDDASSNSFWVSIDGGPAHDWSTSDGALGSGAFAWDSLNSGTAPVTLIDSTTNNGSFESLGSVVSGSTLKAQHWNNSPNGDVPDWTVWGAQSGGPSTAQNDSGTEYNPAVASDGVRIGFLQDGNAARNPTSHLIAAGETFTYSWDWVRGGRGNAIAQLAYQNGADAIAIAGTDTTNPDTATRHLGLGTTWTVPAGHPAIGFPIVMTIRSTGAWPEVDNFILTARPAPLDPLVLNLAAGTHTVTVYAREDGTRLDALRFVSERPLVTFTAPPVARAGETTSVGVSFSESVTGLVIGDFSVAGATIDSLTGAGANYTLIIRPTGTPVTLVLPENSVIDGAGNGNHLSKTATIQIHNLFEQWSLDSGLGTAGGDEDPNHDGIVLLMDFLLNLDPLGTGAPTFDPSVGPAGLPRVSTINLGGGQQRLRIEFPRNAAAVAAGYRYIAEFSDDLIAWESKETGSLVPMDAEWGHMTIDDTPSTSARSRRFVRLRTEVP